MTNTKKELSFDEMKTALEVGTVKHQLENSLNDIKQGQNQLLSSITSVEGKDIFQQKLEGLTLDELKIRIQSRQFVNDMFTSEDGEDIVLNESFENEQKAYEFKRDLIIFLKTSQVYEAKIDTALEKIAEDFKEFETEMDNICNSMSDNILGFVTQLKEKAETLTGDEKRRADDHILHIESAYTMELLHMVIAKHPSVIANTKKEFNTPVLRQDIIARYTKACNRAEVEPLFANIVKGEKMPFEERFLIPGSYQTEAGLFMFILMKYFAINEVKGLNVKFHSTLSVCMRNIYRNKMIDSIKDKFIASITELLNKYN